MSQIVADGKKGIIQSFWSGLETSIGKVTDKLGVFGDVFKQILLDLAKLATSQIFAKLFGGASSSGSSSGSGGFGNILQGIFGGGSGSGSSSGGFNLGSIFGGNAGGGIFNFGGS